MLEESSLRLKVAELSGESSPPPLALIRSSTRNTHDPQFPLSIYFLHYGQSHSQSSHCSHCMLTMITCDL